MAVVDQGVERQICQSDPLEVLKLGATWRAKDEPLRFDACFGSLRLKSRHSGFWVFVEPNHTVWHALQNPHPRGKQVRRDAP